MRVLIVISAVGQLYGGPSKCVLELAHSLGEYGHTVDVVTTNKNDTQKLDVSLEQWLNQGSYRIQYFPYWDLSDFRCISWSLTKWLLKHLNNYDLVHTNAIFSYPALPAYVLCNIYKIPYVVTPHGMLEPWALTYKSWKKRFIFEFFEKPALQKAFAIHALAIPESQGIQKLDLNTSIAVIPNGIKKEDFIKLENPDFFYTNYYELKDKKIILFLGRIDPKKGLDLLAEAFSSVHIRFPETHLVIAGPDNIGFLSNAKSYFKANSCLEAVTFTGMLSGRMKYAVLAAADIYVAPSYSEGFSISVLEGMASGLPCVITTGCNFPEAKTHGIAYVVETQAKAIADALKDCISKPKESELMGQKAREFILNHYIWKSIAEQMTALYQNAIQMDVNPLNI
ncbi:MAG: glycosyltransferase [Leptolyngbya sp. SIO3F4]|nr:glycosyltransferase [Leptolyngbya sp. SIO3F4]